MLSAGSVWIGLNGIVEHPAGVRRTGESVGSGENMTHLVSKVL